MYTTPPMHLEGTWKVSLEGKQRLCTCASITAVTQFVAQENPDECFIKRSVPTTAAHEFSDHHDLHVLTRAVHKPPSMLVCSC